MVFASRIQDLDVLRADDLLHNFVHAVALKVEVLLLLKFLDELVKVSRDLFFFLSFPRLILTRFLLVVFHQSFVKELEFGLHHTDG